MYFTSNGLSNQRSPNTSYVHDIPIVPPQPATYKEYKEIVPDISVVSDIVDNESPAENLRNPSQEVPKLTKYYFHNGLTSGTLPLNKASLLRRNSCTDKFSQHTSCEQNVGINSCFSKSPKRTFNSNETEDYFLLSKHPSCQCHALNDLAFERWNERSSSPKSKPNHISSPRTSDEGKIEREPKCTLQNAECILSKNDCQYLETFENSNPCTDCNFNFKDDEHLSCEIVPNKSTCTQKIKDCCCSKKQCLKSNRNCEHEKHVSFDIESRKTENPERRQENKIHHRNSDTSSRNCKKKNCQCKSKIKKSYLNSSTKITADSPASDEHASKNEKADISKKELLNIWDYIKQQDEKINLLQEQIKTLTENSSCCHKSYVEEKIDSLNTTESDVPYILNILEVHGEKIQELHNQISSLSLIDMKSSDISNNENNMLKEMETKNSANKNTCPENTGQTDTSSFISNTVCHEQVQVTKTSASTMTSLTFENNDKLVFHKHLTVVTDFMKQTKEIPAGCELRKDETSARKNHLNKKGLISSSRKKKIHNSEKHSPNLKVESNKQVISSSSSDIQTSSDVQEIRTIQCEKDSSPHVLKKNELQAIEEKEKTYPAKFKNVLKNVNELILDKDQERHKKKSPGQKTAPKSKPRQPRQKLRQHTSPKLVDTPISKTSKNRKETFPSKSSSSSNTSTDSFYQSPEHKQHVFKSTESELSEDSDQYEPQRFELSGTELEVDNHKFEESATISRYGLSSPNLSVATQRYLENYGLVRDKNNSTKSVRKARTSLSKRYIS